ncbi:peptidyl-tRNA hydrolase II [Hysterangium stoloniferum]|nr:peptidyl-tRNA hydrolase II [Hysterangium stoloniferum]
MDRDLDSKSTVEAEPKQVVPSRGGGLTESELEPLTIQIVVRRDLLDAEGWGVGPLLSQAAHVAIAVVHEYKDLEDTKVYLSDLKNMHKVRLYTTKVSNESSLLKLAYQLSNAEPPIPHHLWVEQPECIPTCLALSPNRKEKRTKKILDKAGCRLFRT